MERRDDINITLELLEKLQIDLMLREDELAGKTEKSLERAGKLNDPDLSELANEVEKICLQLCDFEKFFARIDAAEKNKE